MKSYLLNKLLVIGVVLSMFIGCSSDQKKISDSGAMVDVSSRPIEKLIIGWKEMVRDIKKDADHQGELLEKSFKLKVLLSGDWNLTIYPHKAFKVYKINESNVFEVVVVNPQLLFESKGGITKLTYIQAELSRAEGYRGSIELNANIGCLFKVEFALENGKKIDFKKLSEAYEYNFIATPAHLLEVESMGINYVVFSRKEDNNGDIKVKMQLIDKRNREIHFSNEVNIPQCLLVEQDLKLKEIFIPRTANHCVQHLRTIGNKVDHSKKVKLPLSEFFANSCYIPVRCKMEARYNYLKGQKVVHMDLKTYYFTINPYSSVKVDTSWRYDNYKSLFERKSYMASHYSKSTLPSDIAFKDEYGYLECNWASNLKSKTSNTNKK